MRECTWPWDASVPGLAYLRDVRPGTRCETINGEIITRLAGFDGHMPKMSDSADRVGYMVRDAVVRPLPAEVA